MKALTIKQPWASLIMFGGKDIENRDWHAPAYLIGERIAIHSSKKLDESEFEDAIYFCLERKLPFLPDVDSVKGGVILGTVSLVDCVREHSSPWFVGDHGFVLADPEPLKAPVQIRGALGFWNWRQANERRDFIYLFR